MQNKTSNSLEVSSLVLDLQVLRITSTSNTNSEHLYVHMHALKYAHTYIHTYICTYVCTYVCIQVRMCGNHAGYSG